MEITCAFIHKSDVYTNRTTEPEYTIKREPVDGEILEFLVMEVKLPGIVNTCIMPSWHVDITAIRLG